MFYSIFMYQTYSCGILILLGNICLKKPREMHRGGDISLPMTQNAAKGKGDLTGNMVLVGGEGVIKTIITLKTLTHTSFTSCTAFCQHPHFLICGKYYFCRIFLNKFIFLYSDIGQTFLASYFKPTIHSFIFLFKPTAIPFLSLDTSTDSPRRLTVV